MVCLSLETFDLEKGEIEIMSCHCEGSGLGGHDRGADSRFWCPAGSVALVYTSGSKEVLVG